MPGEMVRVVSLAVAATAQAPAVDYERVLPAADQAALTCEPATVGRLAVAVAGTAATVPCALCIGLLDGACTLRVVRLCALCLAR